MATGDSREECAERTRQGVFGDETLPPNSAERQDRQKISQESVERILQYAIESGILDIANIKEQVDMAQRKEILDRPTYGIIQNGGGQWETRLSDGIHKGKAARVARTTKEDIEGVIVSFCGRGQRGTTVREAFEEWNRRRLGLGKISPATFDRNAVCFARHYDMMGEREIGGVSPNEFLEFLEEQVSRFGMTAKDFSNLKGITRGFLKRAKRLGLVGFDVEAMLHDIDMSDSEFRKSVKEDRDEVFDEEEYATMTGYLGKHLDARNVGILLMFVTGIRIGELVALTHECVGDGVIRIRRTESRFKDENGKDTYVVKEYPKTAAGVRTVVIPPAYGWLCGVANGLSPDGEYVFANEDGSRMHSNSIRNRLKRVCRKLGIKPKSPHKIRKTYGTILLDNNIDKRLIMGQMGHTEISCTENHYHRNRRSIERKAEILGGIAEFRDEAGQVGTGHGDAPWEGPCIRGIAREG